MALIKALRGPVTLIPIYKAVFDRDDERINNFFTRDLPRALENFYAMLKQKYGQSKSKAVQHYSKLGWLVDLVFSSGDGTKAIVRIVTNMKVLVKGPNVKVFIRDPSTWVGLVQKAAITAMCDQSDSWDQLELAKTKPSEYTSKSKQPVSKLRNDKQLYTEILKGKLRAKQSPFFGP